MFQVSGSRFQVPGGGGGGGGGVDKNETLRLGKILPVDNMLILNYVFIEGEYLHMIL
jgi:hypothetical protein